MVALGVLVLSPYVHKEDLYPWSNTDTHIQGGDGSRQPTEKELELATLQGKAFYEAVSKAHS